MTTKVGTHRVFDAAIIGAGPAGLAAADRFGHAGLHVALIDSGKHVLDRDRNGSADVTAGHGGAGLFSDGKFSFFPASTDLWSLPDKRSLRQAYEWTSATLGSYGMDAPPFPEDPSAVDEVLPSAWTLKEYPSFYMPLGDRLDLIGRLVDKLDVESHLRTTVRSARYDDESGCFRLSLSGGAQRRTLRSRMLIYAGGRFGTLQLGMSSSVEHFRRLELGVRIQQPSDAAFFKAVKQLDPKFKFHDPDARVEWRTFCACRDGETVLSETQGLWTVSGRADCAPTGRSNIGFNTRILDPELAREVWPTVRDAASTPEGHFELPLATLLDGGEIDANAARFLTPRVCRLIRNGLTRLEQRFPSLRHPETTLIGPTIEGIGWYPSVTCDLQVPGQPAWVVGDTCGAFRGIVAAMVSGAYAASRAVEHFHGTR